MTETLIACDTCGASFPRVNHNSRYCSRRCKRKGTPSRQRYAARRRAVVKALACELCGTTFETTHKRRFCGLGCRTIAYGQVVQCESCDQPFKAKSKVARFCGRSCSAQHAAAERRLHSGPPVSKGHSGRAKRFGCAYEVIDRAVVFARDGWVCGLCDRPVDATVAWPNPWSASLDHVMPLSLGGSHLYDNVQLAHLTCNISKGARHGSTEEATR